MNKDSLTLSRWIILVAVIALAGCDTNNIMCYISQCGNSSSDKPGSYSYYAMETFELGQQMYCSPYLYAPDPTSDAACFYQVRDNWSANLKGNSWTPVTAITDGNLNGTWTNPDINSAQIITESANVMYIATHGGIRPINGNSYAYLCLRNCDGYNYGSDIATGTMLLPSSWLGPNWLLVDSCSVVKPNVGWEPVFGGNLHGILGFNQDNTGLNPPGLQKLAQDMVGFNKAIASWEDAAGVSGVGGFVSILVPAANRDDVMEAPGGPHFGYNNDTQPTSIEVQPDGGVGVSSVATLSSAPTSIYSLNAEQMNESYWYNTYGGGSVPSTITHPSSNENLYRNPYVSVDHFLASGGLSVAAASTGTAKGFSGAQAYQYALNWIQSNGQLPPDAVLTFAGDEVMTPSPGNPTKDQPYPNVRMYTFTWRHGNSSLLHNDFIQINVDDDGSLTQYQGRRYDVKCQCWYNYTYYAPPWVPKYHLREYVRVWRSLGTIVGTYQASQTMQSYGYCADDMTQTQSQAKPCGVTLQSQSTTYSDLTYGGQIGGSENI